MLQQGSLTRTVAPHIRYTKRRCRAPVSADRAWGPHECALSQPPRRAKRMRRRCRRGRSSVAGHRRRSFATTERHTVASSSSSTGVRGGHVKGASVLEPHDRCGPAPRWPARAGSAASGVSLPPARRARRLMGLARRSRGRREDGGGGATWRRWGRARGAQIHPCHRHRRCCHRGRSNRGSPAASAPPRRPGLAASPRLPFGLGKFNGEPNRKN